MPLHFILSLKYSVTPPPICPAFSSGKVGSLATSYPADYSPPFTCLCQLLHQGCPLSPGILIHPSYFLNTRYCCKNTGMFCPSTSLRIAGQGAHQHSHFPCLLQLGYLFPSQPFQRCTAWPHFNHGCLTACSGPLLSQKFPHFPKCLNPTFPTHHLLRADSLPAS